MAKKNNSSRKGKHGKKEPASSVLSLRTPSTTVPSRTEPANRETVAVASLGVMVGFIWADERPLKGALGLLDWQLCGQISSLLTEQVFKGKKNETLLFGITHPKGPLQLFLFGLGEIGAADETHAQQMVSYAKKTLTKAKVSHCAIAAPRSYGSLAKDQLIIDALLSTFCDRSPAVETILVVPAVIK